MGFSFERTAHRDGYVRRPDQAPVGKVLPTELTPRGRRSLEKATVAVRSVETAMLDGVTDRDQAVAFGVLRRVVANMGEDHVTD